MKPLTITIRPVRIGDRAVSWYAQIDAKDIMGIEEKLFYRSSKIQVQKLVDRMKSAKVEIRK